MAFCVPILTGVPFVCVKRKQHFYFEVFAGVLWLYCAVLTECTLSCLTLASYDWFTGSSHTECHWRMIRSIL